MVEANYLGLLFVEKRWRPAQLPTCALCGHCYLPAGRASLCGWRGLTPVQLRPESAGALFVLFAQPVRAADARADLTARAARQRAQFRAPARRVLDGRAGAVERNASGARDVARVHELRGTNACYQ